ncbi:MAG: glycoside hydrolase family 16 protein [Bacteroidota bacterium]
MSTSQNEKRKYPIYIVSVFLIFILSASSVNVYAQSAISKRMKLVWNDEFNREGSPDSAKWSKIERSGAANKGSCFASMSDDARCVVIKNGKLYLRGILNDNKNDTVDYLTGGLSSKGKFEFIRGKVEFRAKLENCQGAWPALWLFMSGSSKDRYAEIDVIERLNHDDFVYHTVHTAYTLRDPENGKNPPKYSTSKIKAGKYNIYGAEITDDRIIFTLNKKEVFSYPRVQPEKEGQWTFDQNMFIFMSQQFSVKGAWAGPVKEEELPVQMIIDWVRVFQNE